MDEYPSANDYREIVEDFVGRDKTQTLLRNEKNFLVHADTKAKVADVSRLIFYGHKLTEALREGALEYDADTKSTAFSLYSQASNEDLLSDLKTARDDETVFDDKKNLRIQSAEETVDGVQVTIEYVNKKPGRRELVTEDEKDTSVVMVETDHDNYRNVKQNYERIDEFNAITTFFESWKKKRDDDNKPPLKRYNISIQRLSIAERIGLFDDLFSYEPGNWVLEDVRQIGIKQGEKIIDEFEGVEDEDDLREELDENLKGITDAVLTGEGLQANSFVQKCRNNGYYFKSTILYLDNVDVAEKVEVLIEFKEGARNTFDVSIEQGYKKENGEVLRTALDADREASIRDQFRNMVIDIYGRYLENTEIREQDIANTSLTDIRGINEATIENLNAMGFESIEDVRDSTVDELKRVPNIGDELAERLVNS